MREHREVVKLLADHVGVRVVRILEDELYKVVVQVKDKGFSLG